VLAALRFSSPDFGPLGELSEKDWKKALHFCDRTQLTLFLGLTCREHLPEWVRARIDGNLRSNAARWELTKSTYREVAAVFEPAGLEFLVLKGFTHYPRFVSDPRHRSQGDLDLLLPRTDVSRAFDIAAGLGYQPISERSLPIDHLPMMIRKTGWIWRGDFFDAESPISLELHFQLWDEPTERFEPAGLDEFWPRRQSRELDDVRFTAFHPADELAYAALHLLRHLLRGSARPFHIYELAWHLQHSAEDAAFWSNWSQLHHASLRRLEAICFSLAQHWFDCSVSPVVEDEIRNLPSDLTRWLTMYSASPLTTRFRPNKDEVWLHWALLDSRAARWTVLRRRLLPEQLPNAQDAVHVPQQQLTWSLRFARRFRIAAYFASRASHHIRALPAVAWSAMRWFGRGTGLGGQFWRFFFAEAFFDFGMFVFFFLYNLYLLQLGFREDFLGLITGVMTAGNIVGSLLAVVAMQRFGIRRTLLVSFTVTAALAALRAYIIFPPVLIGLAAIAGVFSSAWAVAYSPAVTQLTTEKSRPFGFSLICSAGISIGILGGLAAGRLPGWIARLHLAPAGIQSYRLSLFAGCAFILLALVPLSGVKFGDAKPSERKLHRPSPLLLRFLVCMAAWNLGTGVLNPFFNVFFAQRIHLPLQQIGYVFAAAQVAQVVAILLSPLVFRKFGLTRGIAGMQLATAFALLSLAAAGGPIWAAVGYSAYMMSQYMSEPGQFTLLMGSVRAPERNSASALNFLVSFAGQAVAAAGAGWLLARFGYPPVMVLAAVICVLAAILFRVLLADPKPETPSAP
jgi:predicted MFS family arabinose efflux permease